jgi:hypothetical protein
VKYTLYYIAHCIPWQSLLRNDEMSTDMKAIYEIKEIHL